MKIDGKQIASKILEDLRLRVVKLRKRNLTPCLAIILAGSDPASVAYVNQKELKAKSIGIKTAAYNLKSDIQNSELLKLIKKLNNDKAVHGIIVQQPLPAQANLESIINAIDPNKDVDGFHPESKFQMPIAMAVLKILEDVYVSAPEIQSRFTDWLKDKKIVIIGKGETGGRPIIDMFHKMKIPFALIDSKTKKPESLTKKADILISAVGKPTIIKPQMIKKGVILIGIGISAEESAKFTGDYDQNKIKNIASFYTPTPGGVGPVNVAMLLKNSLEAAVLSQKNQQ